VEERADKNELRDAGKLLFSLPWEMVVDLGGMGKKDVQSLLCTCRTMYSHRVTLLQCITVPHLVTSLYAKGFHASAQFSPTGELIAISHGLTEDEDQDDFCALDALQWDRAEPGTECPLTLWTISRDRLGFDKVCDVEDDRNDVRMIAWSADGTRLAAAYSSALILWDVTGHKTQEISLEAEVSSKTLFPGLDGQEVAIVAWEHQAPFRLAVCGTHDDGHQRSKTNTVILSQDGEVLYTIDVPADCLSWAPAGENRLAVGHGLKLYAMPLDQDAGSPTLLANLDGDPGLAWRKQGDKIAICDEYVFNVVDTTKPSEGQFLSTTYAQEDHDHVTFSPDGRMLVAAGLHADCGTNEIVVVDVTQECQDQYSDQYDDGVDTDDVVCRFTEVGECDCDGKPSSVSWWSRFILVGQHCGHIRMFSLSSHHLY